MKLLINIFIGICFSIPLQNSNRLEVPIYYQSIKGCFDGSEKWNSIDQIEVFTKNYNQFFMIEKHGSNPLKGGIVSILNFSHDKIDLIEYDIDISCKGYEVEVTVDTLNSSVTNVDQFKREIEEIFKKLNHFGYKKVNKYRLAGIMDGVLISISYCRNGRCKTNYFDNPWGYYEQDSTIRELQNFIKFEKMMNSRLGKDLWAI